MEPIIISPAAQAGEAAALESYLRSRCLILAQAIQDQGAKMLAKEAELTAVREEAAERLKTVEERLAAIRQLPTTALLDDEPTQKRAAAALQVSLVGVAELPIERAIAAVLAVMAAWLIEPVVAATQHEGDTA